jgi:hypothetical protein
MNVQSYAISPLPLTRRDLPIILGSGFMATLAMTTIMYMLPLLHLGQVDAPLWAARLFIADPLVAAAAGLTIHLFVGFGYAWIYANLIEPRLSLGPVRMGVAYGLALWVFAQAIAVPSLGALAGFAHGDAAASPGVFAARLGAGAAFASLGAHVAYGGVLGFVYGCLFRARCLCGVGSAGK